MVVHVLIFEPVPKSPDTGIYVSNGVYIPKLSPFE